MAPARGSSRTRQPTFVVTPAVRRERAGAGTVRRAVVAGTDFTPGSETALARAEALARFTSSPLVVVHVVSRAALAPAVPVAGGWKRGASGAQGEARGVAAEASLARTRLREEAAGIDAETVVRVGRPHDVLSSVAAAHKAWLLVVGVHGPKHRVRTFFLGTTAERVLRRAAAPVLLARTSPRREYRRVLVALDLGDVSFDVLALVARRFAGTEVHVVHFLSDRTLGERRAKELHARYFEALRGLSVSSGLGPRARVELLAGSARDGILAEAARRRVDLIAMGTQARRGVGRVVLGSVAEYVSRAADVDVLAVPPARRRRG